MEEEFERQLKKVLGDNQSGSRALALNVATLFEEAAKQKQLHGGKLRQLVRNACRRLVGTHSTMRALRALCDDVILILDTTRKDEDLSARLLRTLSSWDGLYTGRILMQIVSYAYPVLVSAKAIVSHSCSMTVLEVLSGLLKRNKDLEVVQTVSEPAREGLEMAASIAKKGAKVRLIADAGLATAAKIADVVIVGADSVGIEGVVNKLGTMALAAAARYFRTPIYSVFDSAKLVPPGTKTDIVEKNPLEVADISHDNIKVYNVYFDCTPLELFTGLITENGLYKPEEMRRFILGMLDADKE